MKNPDANRCSSLPAFWLCPSSWAPIDTLEPERDKSAANLGSAVHAFIAEMLTGGETIMEPDAEAEPLVETALEAWGAIREEAKGDYGVENLDTTPYLSGHLDADGNRWLVDWKSGWRDTDYSPQTKGYAWLKWAEAGRPDEFTVTTYTVWLRFHKYDKEVYTAEDLRQWEAEYVAKLSQIGEVVNPGEACLWCPRKHECHAHTAWICESHAMILSDGAALTTREQLAEAWPRLQELSKAVEEAKKRVRAAAEEKPLDLGDGYELKIVGGSKTTIDPEAAWDLLTDYIPLEALSKCVTVQKGKVIQAVRDSTPKGEKKKDMEAEFLSALHGLGALVKKETAGQMRRVKKEVVGE